MDEIKLESTVRGTRIITGQLAKKRRTIINNCIAIAEENKFDEVVLPAIEPEYVYTTKAGSEIISQMYVFEDKKGRKLCLRPEGTATCQLIAQVPYKYTKDVKLWYVTSCYRYERPQEGRYREFTQFGVEILNPSVDYTQTLITVAESMVKKVTAEYEVNKSVKRGLAYYTQDGFEIVCPSLGAQKQVCGGGPYVEGIGFAIGIDRLMLL